MGSAVKGEGHMSEGARKVGLDPESVRADCYCGKYRKPCTYHEGYEDGYDQGQRAAYEEFTASLAEALPGEP
jgi:flagellar biosynthesis/type III secretory pathway protein FliH